MTDTNRSGECTLNNAHQYIPDTSLEQTRNTEWSSPDPVPITAPNFSWGTVEAQSFSALIAQAYDEVVHWRMNLFLVTFGKAGKQFIFQLTKLYRALAEGSALEGIALKASKVLTVLTLQNTYRNLKAKVNSRFLERRLNSWKNGQVDELLAEGRSIQKRNFHGGFSPAPSKLDSPMLARSFAKHMFQGRCGAAIR